MQDTALRAVFGAKAPSYQTKKTTSETSEIPLYDFSKATQLLCALPIMGTRMCGAHDRVADIGKTAFGLIKYPFSRISEP